MEQKEQTKCMGSDGMQKMNGVINTDLMTVEETQRSIVRYKANDRTSNRLCKKCNCIRIL